MAHRTSLRNARNPPASMANPPTSGLSEPGRAYPWRQPDQQQAPQQQQQQQFQQQQHAQLQQHQEPQQQQQQSHAPWRQQPNQAPPPQQQYNQAPPQQQQQPQQQYNQAQQQQPQQQYQPAPVQQPPQQQYQSSQQFQPVQPTPQSPAQSAAPVSNAGGATPWRNQPTKQAQGPMVHQTPQSHQIHLLAGETENYAKPDPSNAPSGNRPKKHFTESQRSRYRRVFDMFDINKDGVLEARELAAVSQIMGYRMPRGQVMGILSHVDLDTNGVLTFEEFLQAMPGNVQHIPEQEHRNAELRYFFQQFDTDCNGVITKDEAHMVLEKELGFTPDQTRAFVNKFDINADGMLSYEEFVEFFAKVKERKQAIDKAFCQFDKDGKGYVSLDDAKRILGGLLFSESEVEALVEAHDTNRDGILQYEEFMHFWTA